MYDAIIRATDADDLQVPTPAHTSVLPPSGSLRHCATAPCRSHLRIRTAGAGGARRVSGAGPWRPGSDAGRHCPRGTPEGPRGRSGVARPVASSAAPAAIAGCRAGRGVRCRAGRVHRSDVPRRPGVRGDSDVYTAVRGFRTEGTCVQKRASSVRRPFSSKSSSSKSSVRRSSFSRPFRRSSRSN